MQQLIVVFVIFSFVSSPVELAKNRPTNLPTYIKKCRVDKTFNDCFVKNANEVIPNILNGDKKFGVPSFSPFLLSEVIFEPTSNLKMHFTNLQVSGFEGAKITTAKLDLEKSEIYFEVKIPNILIKADYTTKGKILVLPLEGNGPCDIRLIDGLYKITTKFENLAEDSKGNVKLIESNVDYTLGRTIYHFENLFNGNKRIGDETNRFLNENHNDLYKDFKPAFSSTIEVIAKTLLDGVLGNLHSTKVLIFP